MTQKTLDLLNNSMLAHYTRLTTTNKQWLIDNGYKYIYVGMDMQYEDYIVCTARHEWEMKNPFNNIIEVEEIQEG